ncbi:unnamed protein product [Leptosia nina]|uniref:Uncharacterized protein n=1 Tax=Leptosia nina TaxID=320188 RepID=A0AAV1J7N0_9NEOP
MVGNERADQLAKEAAHDKKRKPDYDRCPVSKIKRLLRTDSIRRWEEEYGVGTTASTTRFFLPTVASALKAMREVGLDSELTQALTGHGGFAAYLHRFKLKDDPTCICGEGDETVLHLLARCPVHARDRAELEMRLDINLTENSLSEIFSSNKARPKLVKYIKKIVLAAHPPSGAHTFRVAPHFKNPENSQSLNIKVKVMPKCSVLCSLHGSVIILDLDQKFRDLGPHLDLFRLKID